MGIADHFGWAIAVTVDAGGRVVDRRRIELVEAGVTPAPVHYDADRYDDEGLVALIAEVRASIARVSAAAFDGLPDGVGSIALRTWPADFPTDIAVVRRSPWEARADAVMYRQVLAEVVGARGWAVRTYDRKHVLDGVDTDLGLGPPWTADHRAAYAAALRSTRP